MDGNADGDPWYLFSTYIHPHPPLTPPTPWHKLYRPSLMPLPNVPRDYKSLVTYVNRVQNRYKYRDQGTDLNLARAIIAYYYACISFVDVQVDRILDALERTGQLDNTLILFASDHGELLGDYGCYGKRTMHDASARVPMIARMPGRFEGGEICRHPVSLVDIAATIMAATGARVETHELDGVDLLDVATGKDSRRFVFGQLSFHAAFNRTLQGLRHTDNYPADGTTASPERIAAHSTYMCVSEEWKYVYSALDHQEYFFDRVRDPHETRNRKGIPFVANEKAEHRAALVRWLREGGETAGLNDDDTWRRFHQPTIDDDPDTGLMIQDQYTPWSSMGIPGYTG